MGSTIMCDASYPVCTRFAPAWTPLSSLPKKRITAAHLPPELFRDIIQYVCGHNEGEVSPVRLEAPLNTRKCSLVCLYWAQQSRRAQFRNRAVIIESRKQARGLWEIVMSSSSARLVPIVTLIGELWVRYLPGKLDKADKWPFPWYDILFTLIPKIPREKFAWLDIEASPRTSSSCSLCPSSFPSSSVAHPQLPASRYSAPFRVLYLNNMHFASVRDIINFTCRFRHVEQLYFSHLTWDKGGSPWLPRTATLNQAPLISRISVNSCQDDALLFLQLQFGHIGGSLLRTLPKEDQKIIASMIGGMCAAHDDTTTLSTDPCISCTQTLLGQSNL